MASKKKVFYGEQNCEVLLASGAPCTNKAYYRQGAVQACCGVHSTAGRRQDLPKNPDAAAVKARSLAEHQRGVEQAAAARKAQGRAGDVICSKLRMMKGAENHTGYLKVFPNFKHQHRQDGFGCAALSPMSLGPVHHGQKNLPPAKNLENYHQFNKVYTSELGKDGLPKEEFYSRLKQGYSSPTPQRHKFKSKTKEKVEYSTHQGKDGKLRYTYVESRYFYCHFYEVLSKDEADLATLRAKLKEGISLQIVGYDAYPVTDDLMKHYLDVSRPFGHELVLYTLLTVKDPTYYPWNRYYRDHRDLYPACLAPGATQTGSVSVEASTSKAGMDTDEEDGRKGAKYASESDSDSVITRPNKGGKRRKIVDSSSESEGETKKKEIVSTKVITETKKEVYRWSDDKDFDYKRWKKERNERNRAHKVTVKAATADNKRRRVRGGVLCSPLKAQQLPEDHDGYLKVFPNLKHQRRQDGFGCMALSPGALGPVYHRQLNLPTCKILENYHQYNSVYSTEIDIDGEPRDSFFDSQLNGYIDNTPRRFRMTRAGLKSPPKKLFYIHEGPDGNKRHYTYVESRYFLCHFYELLVKNEPDFLHLQKLLDDGTNLQICGYDGCHVDKDLMDHYVDPDHNFRHEMALYTMLTVHDAKDYPWNQYYVEHANIYPKCCEPMALNTRPDPNT